MTDDISAIINNMPTIMIMDIAIDKTGDTFLAYANILYQIKPLKCLVMVQFGIRRQFSAQNDSYRLTRHAFMANVLAKKEFTLVGENI